MDYVDHAGDIFVSDGGLFGQPPHAAGPYLDPIGLKPKDWTRDGAGHIQLPFGAVVSAREWVKFGELIRQRGRWGNRQLVRPELLAECFQPSPANPRYGLTFWLNSGEESARGAKGVKLVQAAGAGKQRLYVIPSRDLVVVRQGLLTKPAFQDREFIQRLVFGKAEVDETKDVPQLISEATRQQVTELFAASDKNGDGRLERSEFPPDRLQYFEPVDLDSDGFVTPGELNIKLEHYAYQVRANRD